jgi:TfoX/Sxy family transcriptional regulator of competence genes
MAYDQGLAQRIREELDQIPNLSEKEMFGGIGFMVNGNMACGVNKEEMIVRVGPENYDQALKKPHTRVFDFTGRPMKGWVMIAPEGYESDEDLKYWIEQGVSFAQSLPQK